MSVFGQHQFMLQRLLHLPDAFHHAIGSMLQNGCCNMSTAQHASLAVNMLAKSCKATALDKGTECRRHAQ